MQPIYLDHNSAGMAPQEVIDTHVRWMNRGAPSAGRASSRKSRKMLQNFRSFLAEHGRFELTGPRGYTIIFTSGAAESNCHILIATSRAYAARTGHLPHIIVSASEHKSVLSCAKSLSRDGMAMITFLPVRKAHCVDAGTVDAAELRQAIRKNTCLVSIIAAHHETGTLNNIKSLAAVARASGVPFHSDIAQLFGRAIVHPGVLGVDAFSATFHKIGGPRGCGVLGIRNNFIDGYGLGALICGSSTLRGGTPNIAAIAGAFAAYRLAYANRPKSVEKMEQLRDIVRAGMSHFKVLKLSEYCEHHGTSADWQVGTIVWLSRSSAEFCVPNTICFAFIRNDSNGRQIRAAKIQSALEKVNAFIGIGAPSAEVALDVPSELSDGIIRISFCDQNTKKDAKEFVARFIKVASANNFC